MCSLGHRGCLKLGLRFWTWVWEGERSLLSIYTKPPRKDNCKSHLSRYSSCTRNCSKPTLEVIYAFEIFLRNRSVSYCTALPGPQAPQMESHAICADPSIAEMNYSASGEMSLKGYQYGAAKLPNLLCLPYEGRLGNASCVTF